MLEEMKIDEQNELAWSMRNSQTKDALRLSRTILERAVELKYELGQASSLRTSAYCNNLMGEHAAALNDCEQSFRLYESLQDNLGLFEITNVFGQIYWELGDYPTALSYVVEMVEHAQVMGDTAREADAHNNLSMIYARIDEMDKALTELNQALPLFRENGDSRGEFFALNNKAMIYHIWGDSEQALETAFESLAVANKIGLNSRKVKVLDTLGEIYIGMGDLENAMIFLNQAISIATEINLKRDHQSALAKIGKVLMLDNKVEEARDVYEFALAIAIETESKKEIFESHHALSDVYESMGDHEKALFHFKRFFHINNEVFSESSSRKLKDLEVRYRTESMRREAVLLRDKNEALNRLAGELDREVYRKTKELRTSLQNEKRLKRSLATALSREQEINQIKSGIINTISHEFRTPLNAIIGYSEYLLEEIEYEQGASSEMSHDIRRINVAGNNMLQLINDVLQLSQISSRTQMKVSISDIEITSFLDSLRRRFDPIMESQGNRFLISNQIESPKILIDLNIVNQILEKLLSNAAKFTENGEIELSLYQPEKGYLAFAVADSGIGIAEEHLEMIFESFRQVENSLSRQYEGTGLGLAIGKGLAEQLSGRIEVESEIGVGSVFTLILPDAIEEKPAEMIDFA